MAERKRKTGDEFCWSCDNRRCSSYRTTKGIRNGSFFQNFTLPLADIFIVIILWSEGKQFKDIILNYGFKKDVLSKIIKKLRQVIIDFYASDQVRLGGLARFAKLTRVCLCTKSSITVEEHPETRCGSLELQTPQFPQQGFTWR